MQSQEPPAGKIVWVDLTVPNATEIRDFYQQLVGWQANEVDMGDYADYGMQSPASGSMVAGICHLRGANANQPQAWMIYISVPDLDVCVATCERLGGKVLNGPRGEGERFCVMQDPAGAVFGLFEQRLG